MDLDDRIKAFAQLGEFLTQFNSTGCHKLEEVPFNDLFFDAFIEQIQKAENHNAWFSKANILHAIEHWSNQLTYNNIKDWLLKYNFKNTQPAKVAVIMAGNIPLVGFHDVLSVLITGHSVLIKPSSNDEQLLPLLCNYLCSVEPQFKDRIEFTQDRLVDFDRVIATGSDNTARYFEYYFKDKPAVIRKNRNSVAVLSGNETEEQLTALSEDIFRYYGLGCRNVSKLYVPENYDFDSFFKAIYDWHPLIHEHKYANNYDYNKAVYLMSEFDILENGFLMLKKDEAFSSPIATLFYETYSSKSQLKTHLDTFEDKIQCVVADGFDDHEVKFGHTQRPALDTYADGVDTVDFLLKNS